MVYLIYSVCKYVSYQLYFIEDEVDLWILTEIGSHVMHSFCQNVGNVSQIDIQLARQFNADVG